MKLRLWAILLILMSAGCVTVPTVEERLAAYDPSTQSILVVHTENNRRCNSTGITISDGSTEYTVTPQRWARNDPAFVIVDAGDIRVTGASCKQSGYEPSQMPRVAAWFEPIEVSPGEVIYFGSLNIGRLTQTEKKSGTSRFWDALLLDLSTDSSVYFPVYSVQNREDDVSQKMKELYPQIEAPIVTRMFPRRIDTLYFSNALDQAFALTEDGDLPPRSLAEARWLEMDIFKTGATLASFMEPGLVSEYTYVPSPYMPPMRNGD